MTNETMAIAAPQRGLLALLRGWAPFVGLLVAYELMRDLAAAIGVQPHNLAPFDRHLFDGYEPTLVLQAAAAQLADRDLLEDAGSLVYGAHFLLPIAIGAWLWAKDRSAFNRFGLTLVILCAMAFATYVVAPTSPPWLAQPSAVRHVIEERPSTQPGLALFESRLQPLRSVPLPARRLPGDCGRGRLAAQQDPGSSALRMGGGRLARCRLPRRALRDRCRRRHRLCGAGNRDCQSYYGTPGSGRASRTSWFVE